LVRYDTKAKQLVPFLGDISAGEVDVSRDGEWVTYTDYPEGNVWRSKIDGSERLQLTFPPFYAREPRWAPDGKQIVFAWFQSKIFVVSANGGVPQQLMPEDKPDVAGAATWSPDGNSIVFGRWAGTEKGVFRLDLKTRQFSKLPGSDGLYSARISPDGHYVAALSGQVKGLRVGVPDEYFGEGLDPEIDRAVRAGIDTLRDLGAAVERVSLPTTKYGVATYYIVAPAEASSNLARYDGVKYGLRVPGARDLIDMYSRTRGAGFGAEVKRRVMLGTYALSAGYYDAYYGKAQKVRTLVQRDFQKAFERVDVIVAPTTPSAAFRTGEKEDPLSMYLNDVFTIPVNLAGLPGVSVPAGFTKGGLPVGLQVIGKAFDEAAVLRTAKAYEGATEWHKRKPELVA